MTHGKRAAGPSWRDVFPGARTWSGVTTVLIVDLLWIAADPRLTLSVWSYKYLAVTVGLAATFGVLIPHSLQRVRDTALGLLFVVVAFAALRMLNHLTMALGFPRADELLAGFDASIGLNWHNYATWIARYPFLVEAFDVSYSSLTKTTTLGLAVLFLLGRFDRAGTFIRLVFWSGLAAILIGMLFPANGAMVHFSGPDLAVAFGPGVGTYFVPYLEALWSTDAVLLSIAHMPGLVSFPSFHTACGILLAYACRDVRFLGPVVFVYVAVMIAATPIMGGHYLVDLPAGALLAVAVIALDRALGRRRLGGGAVSPAVEPTRTDG